MLSLGVFGGKYHDGLPERISASWSDNAKLSLEPDES